MNEVTIRINFLILLESYFAVYLFAVYLKSFILFYAYILYHIYISTRLIYLYFFPINNLFIF